jgi:hypothetical protein
LAGKLELTNQRAYSFKKAVLPIAKMSKKPEKKLSALEKLQASIFYSSRYYDDIYEYR